MTAIYSYYGINRNILTPEATSKYSRMEVSRNVYNILKKEGLLADQADVKDISGCINDCDSDGYYEVDVNQLIKTGIIKTSMFKCDRRLVNNLLKGKHSSENIAFTEYVPNNLEWKEKTMEPSTDYESYKIIDRNSSKPMSEQEAPLSGENQLGSSILLIEKLDKFLEGNDHTLSHVSEFLSKFYHENGIGSFNTILQQYLYNNFIHTLDSVNNVGNLRLPPWDTSDKVDGNTSPNKYSQFEGKARIDCDIFAQIGFSLIDSLPGEFDLNIVTMYGVDPKNPPHAILVYTEVSSGRTFVLDNQRISEVDYDKYKSWEDYVKDNFSGYMSFTVFDSTDNYNSAKPQRVFV